MDWYDDASYILMLTAKAVEPQEESLQKCISQSVPVHHVAVSCYLSLVFIVLGLVLFYSFWLCMLPQLEVVEPLERDFLRSCFSQHTLIDICVLQRYFIFVCHIINAYVLNGGLALSWLKKKDYWSPEHSRWLRQNSTHAASTWLHK